MPSVTDRLDSLESILGQFIVHTDVSLRRLENEMRKFKDEMVEKSSHFFEFFPEYAGKK